MTLAVVTYAVALALLCSGSQAVPSGWNPSPLEFSVPETTFDTTTTLVGAIECVESDEDVPTAVSISLDSSVLELFELRPGTSSGSVELHRIAELDYEAGPISYLFNITCRDGSGSINNVVRVNVTSVDEFIPMIDFVPDATLVISESSPVGTVVLSPEPGMALARVVATDGDEGIHGELEFQLSSSEPEVVDYFNFSQNDGTLTLNRILDRDVPDTPFPVFLTITVCDTGRNPSLCPSNIITLYATPDNEFDPQFSQGNYNTVKSMYTEGQYINEVISDVACSDADRESVGVFSGIELINVIPELSQVLWLKVNSSAVGTAQVVLDGELDYDAIQYSQVLVKLRCYDNGNPEREGTANLMLHVEGIDDNRPVFSSDTYEKTVPESLTVGAEILTVDCSDMDYGVGRFEAVEVTNSSNNATKVFLLNSTSGVLTLLQSLDFDKGPQQYQLTVRCFDTSGNDVHAMVVISVNGTNDEPVQFTQSRYQFTVQRLEPPRDVVVGQVQTTDGDIGQQAHTTYSIEDNPNFGIDKDGNILLQDFILYAEGDTFQFSVYASDRMNSEAAAMVEVQVEGPLSLLDIVFIVIGALLLLLVVIIIIFSCCCLRRCRRRPTDSRGNATALKNMMADSDEEEYMKGQEEEEVNTKAVEKSPESVARVGSGGNQDDEKPEIDLVTTHI